MDETGRAFVVVGGGLGGGKAVEELRSAGYAGPLVLVAAERHQPYERPPLSKDVLLGNADRDTVFVHPPGWYAEHDVELVLGDAVEQVDRAAQEVVTASGRRIGYERLLLATGATPRLLTLPDLDAAHRERVLTLRTLDDNERLDAWLACKARVAVVGGGWIGMEVAAAARQRGCEVTVVEMGSLPLQRILGEQVACIFAGVHRSHGVDLRTGVTVDGLEPDGDGIALRLGDGTQVHADVVVVGVGVTPNVELAEQAGLDVDNGIVTDAQLRTSDPHVFAVGDVANVLYSSVGERLRVEHWASALNQPAVAARAMLGGPDTWDLLPYFYTDQFELSCEYTGYVPRGAQDDVVLRPGPDGGHLAFWLDGRRVRAAMSLSADGFPAAEELVRSRREVDPAVLADPAQDWQS